MTAIEEYAKRYFVLLNAINDAMNLLDKNQPEMAKSLLFQMLTDTDRAYLQVINGTY